MTIVEFNRKLTLTRSIYSRTVRTVLKFCCNGHPYEYCTVSDSDDPIAVSSDIHHNTTI
jgi:hypothetical protein